ncbi:MAG TPA: hypothetical protein VHW46_07715 [Terracidiphilus sp.]|jgi:hypothetical protein|nr:hypothetical protein [Terracidiphilus sp.]
MHKFVRHFTPLAFAAALALPIVLSGCTVHAGYAEDPYYHDRHVWSGEVGYYNQWEHDTHRNHEDFKKRNDPDKKAYWDWRHSHDDHH